MASMAPQCGGWIGGAKPPGPFLEIINKYAEGLPFATAHAVGVAEADKTQHRIYWVSSASLVTLDYRLEKADRTARADGRVRSLASAARVEIEAVVKSNSRPVERTIRLYFPDESEPVVLPDPLMPLDLDDAAKLEQVDTFLDELLRALDGHPSAPR